MTRLLPLLLAAACTVAPEPQRPRPRPPVACISAISVTPDAESVTRKECVYE